MGGLQDRDGDWSHEASPSASFCCPSSLLLQINWRHRTVSRRVDIHRITRTSSAVAAVTLITNSSSIIHISSNKSCQDSAQSRINNHASRGGEASATSTFSLLMFSRVDCG